MAMILCIDIRDLGSDDKVSKCYVVSTGAYVFYWTRSNCLYPRTSTYGTVKYAFSYRHNSQIDVL
jgi:hypothetical protein